MKSMFRDGALYAQWMERCEEFGIEVRTIEVILPHLSVKAGCYPSQISLHTLHMPHALHTYTGVGRKQRCSWIWGWCQPEPAVTQSVTCTQGEGGGEREWWALLYCTQLLSQLLLLQLLWLLWFEGIHECY